MAAIPTYVAEMDKQAHREAKAHMQWLFNTGLKIKSSHYCPADTNRVEEIKWLKHLLSLTRLST